MNAFEITTFLITPSNLDYYGSFLFYLHLYWDTLKPRNITVLHASPEYIEIQGLGEGGHIQLLEERHKAAA